MISDKVIFQYGNANEPNYIFFKQKFRGQLSTGVKSQRADSAFMDGTQRLNGARRNKRQGYSFNYSFFNPFVSIFNSDFINRVFFDKPRLCFWNQVEDFNDDPSYIRLPNKWFYNIADCTVPPMIRENIRNNETTPDLEYDIVLTLEKPYLYDCSADIEYVDLNAYLAGLTRWKQFNWQGKSWGSQFAPQPISGLTPAEIKEFFAQATKLNTNYFLFLRDRFFKRDISQLNRNYVLDTSVGANSTLDIATTNAFRQSPAENQIYRIELGQLTVGKVVTILNLGNNSGIKLTWLGASDSAATLVYNSYHQKLYFGAGEDEVASVNYNIDVVGERGLYFSGLLNPRPFSDFANEAVRITNTGAGTLSIKIDALITY